MDERRVERRLVLPLAPEALWPALAEPGRLGAWLGTDVDLDVRPGGKGSVRVGGEVRRVLVEEVDPPRRLAFRWRTMDPGALSTRVELTLTAVPGGTRLDVVEVAAWPSSPPGGSGGAPRPAALARA